MAAAGWAALLMAALFMSAAGIALWTCRGRSSASFMPNAAVIAAGVTLLRIAAFFELFDGLQVVATGALRGIGDTRSPMLAHFIGYWVIGMPVVYVPLLSAGMGRARHLDRLERGADPDRRGAGADMAEEIARRSYKPHMCVERF